MPWTSKDNKIYWSDFFGLIPNKPGLYEGSFFWGYHISYFKKNLSNINITLCNCLTNYDDREKILLQVKKAVKNFSL